MKDWMIRAYKTFVQAFLGVLVPELILLFQSGWPASWDTAWAYLSPVVAAGLAAAISAVWNIILEWINKESEE